MVQKIQASEYLKRYDNMTAEERAEYAERMARWMQDSWGHLNNHTDDLGARFQNILTISIGWNDEECRMFEEGAKLLSAQVYVEEAKTWLPDMLYVKSAKRVIEQMGDEVFGAYQRWEEEVERAKGEGEKGKGEGRKDVVEGKPQDKHEKETAMDTGTAMQSPDTGQRDATPVRPTHIDQYVHLLPKKTQERAAMVKGLLTQLDVAREKARLLMDEPHANGADRARWAKEATKCDKEVRAIYKELDDEWEKLVKKGGVVVDDLGNVRVIATADAVDTVAGGRKGTDGAEGKDETEGSDGSNAENEPKDLAKRRSLRKWLTDVRHGNSSEETKKEHAKKWTEKFAEYLSIEGESAFEDEKIKAAAQHYGAEMSKE